MKILLTGKNGQIGAELSALLPRVGEVVALDRSELNLANFADLRRCIREIRPRLIVNAAAYTAVDRAESEEAAARAANSEAPAIMAEEAKKIGAALVHYSTDYVFDGSKTSPYTETDSPNPVSAYGRTKLEGEKAIRDSGVPHLILRTAWVYGTRGHNFLLTILRLAADREELRVVTDQIGAPTWSRAIAQATAEILEHECDPSRAQPLFAERSGTYHISAAGSASWHEFAGAIVEEARRISPTPEWLAAATGARPLLVKRITPVTTREYPTSARRPAYSVLSNRLIAETFGVRTPDWRELLRAAFTQPSQPGSGK